MTEQTEQGRGPGAGTDRPSGGPDPERTQALPVEGTSARTVPLEGPSARTAPLDGEARPVVAGVAPVRTETRPEPRTEPRTEPRVEARTEPPTPARTEPRLTSSDAPRGSSPERPAPSSAPVDLGKSGRTAAEDDERPRSGPPRTSGTRPSPRGGSASARSSSSGNRQRRAKLRLRSIDPWSVFVLSLLVSLFLAVVLVVAVVALYAVLQAAGVPDSINALYAEVTRAPGGSEPDPLLSAGRALTTAGVLAVVNVVLVTALSTLSAVLYNLCASFTGGVEVTLAEHDS